MSSRNEEAEQFFASHGMRYEDLRANIPEAAQTIQESIAAAKDLSSKYSMAAECLAEAEKLLVPEVEIVEAPFVLAEARPGDLRPFREPVRYYVIAEASQDLLRALRSARIAHRRVMRISEKFSIEERIPNRSIGRLNKIEERENHADLAAAIFVDLFGKDGHKRVDIGYLGATALYYLEYDHSLPKVKDNSDGAVNRFWKRVHGYKNSPIWKLGTVRSATDRLKTYLP